MLSQADFLEDENLAFKIVQQAALQALSTLGGENKQFQKLRAATPQILKELLGLSEDVLLSEHIKDFADVTKAGRKLLEYAQTE